MDMRMMHWARGLLLAVGLLLLAACGSSPPLLTTSETTSPTPAVREEQAGPTDQGTAVPATTAPTAESGVSPRPVATTALTDTLREPARAARGLLINLTTDDTWSATMAIGLGQRALEQQVAPVIIFLNVRGVYLGDRERLSATVGGSERNLHEQLQAFLAAGGQVIACPSCSREAGLTQADYLEGIVVGEPGGLVPFLTDPNLTVISYTEHDHRE